MSFIYKLIGNIGILIIILSVLIFLGIGIYAITIWWGVIIEYGFWGLVGGVVLFPITIPLSPIYLGMEGDWGPTGGIIFGLVAAYFVCRVGIYFVEIGEGDEGNL